MFDNPEKLFIILLIALFIFGPQKLIGLGSSMGKAIREFRGHVRDAQEQFHSAITEAQQTAEETFTAAEPPALPAPEPIVPELPAPSDPIQAAQPAAPASEAAVPPAPAPTPASTSPAETVAEDEGPHSLASEPSSQAVWETLQRRT
jgi:TatA/E family protein of Tat protein translocase